MVVHATEGANVSKRGKTPEGEKNRKKTGLLQLCTY